MHDGAHRVNPDNRARNLRQRPAVRATTMHDRRSLGHRHAVHSGAHALKGVSRQSGAPQGPRNARPATICNNAPTLTASHQNPTAGSVTAGPRYHAFDAIRGAAMSLGVVLHGAVAYMAVPLPGLVWPVHDQATSPVIDGLFWWIHGFRIPLFFVVAGFFSVMLHNSRGGDKYLAHRTRRILVPLLLAVATIMPLVAAVWVLGWLDTGQYTWEQIEDRQFGEQQTGVGGIAHLWFLRDLYIYCLAFWLWRWLAGRMRPTMKPHPRAARLAQTIFRSPLKPLLLAVPTFALLAAEPGIVARFSNSYLPEAPELVYHFWFFLVGTWLYTMREQLAAFVRFSAAYLIASVLVAVVMIRLLHGYHTMPPGQVLPMAERLALAGTIALFCWLSVFAWLGLFLKLFSHDRPAVRWLSDSSYWVYLVHLPLVALTHIGLGHVSGPAVAEFAVAVVLTYAICLMTYQHLVRYTAIGMLLNGPRRKGGRAAPAAPIDASAGDGSADRAGTAAVQERGQS